MFGCTIKYVHLLNVLQAFQFENCHVCKKKSKLVAHIEEGRMIKQHAKTVSEEFRGELKNREPDKE